MLSKKISSLLLAVLVLLFLSKPCFCGSKKTWGAILTIAGLVLAANGYAKVDISNPSLNVSGNWTKEQSIGSWWGHAGGSYLNTGNTNILTGTIYVGYYDAYGSLITIDYNTYSGCLTPGQSGTWTVYNTYCGGYEPFYAAYTGTYTYEKLYGYRNESQGQIGILCTLVGIYCLTSNSTNTNRYSKFMDRHSLEVKLRTDLNCVKVAVIKRI
jgi:hypothetical protein